MQHFVAYMFIGLFVWVWIKILTTKPKHVPFSLFEKGAYGKKKKR